MQSTANSSQTSATSSLEQCQSPTTIESEQKLKLYTSRYTPPCRAVAMLAAHLDIHMDEINIRTFIDTRTEKFKKLNPLHSVPVLDDNGFILWESRVIMQYICNKYAPESSIYPRDPKKRAVVDRLLYFDLKTLSNAVFEVHYEFTFPSEYSSSRAVKLVAVNEALTLLEIFLINKNYMACEHLTIADLTILASVTLLEVAVEFDLTSYPNIWGWYNRLRNELPYYDPQTKIVHGELKEIIKGIRDKHEDWSTPLHRCAFVPGDGPNQCEEQQAQYKRLFLKQNDKKDAERIMAAVRPAVFRQPFHNPQTCRSNCSPGLFSDHSDNVGDISSTSSECGSVSTRNRKKSSGRMSTCSQEDACAGPPPTSNSSTFKRIKLTVELNSAEPFSFDSPDIQLNPEAPRWDSAQKSTAIQTQNQNQNILTDDIRPQQQQYNLWPQQSYTDQINTSPHQQQHHPQQHHQQQQHQQQQHLDISQHQFQQYPQHQQPQQPQQQFQQDPQQQQSHWAPLVTPQLTQFVENYSQCQTHAFCNQC